MRSDKAWLVDDCTAAIFRAVECIQAAIVTVNLGITIASQPGFCIDIEAASMNQNQNNCIRSTEIIA